MFKKLKNSNNKGLTSFIAILIALIIIVVFAFAFDLVDIVRKRQAFNRHMNYVARVIAKQGGIKDKPNSNDDDYVTEAKNYETSKSMIDKTNYILEQNYIDNDQWEIYITNTPNHDLTNFSSRDKLTPSFKRDFNFSEDIYIYGRFEYQWRWTSSVLPFPKTSTHTHTKLVASEKFN